LEGLEISEIKFCEIDLSDRYDAEYFAKEYLELEDRLLHCKTDILENLSKMTASAFYPAATQLYDYGDTPFVRCVDCIGYPVITEQQNEAFEKIPYDFAVASKGISFLKNSDIVITKVGSPCFASIITDYNEVALSRTVMGLTDVRNVNPLYLMVFLRCRYGFDQLFRQRELTIQYQLTLGRVGKVVVYLPPDDFQSEIAKFVERYKRALGDSRILYATAETTLLHALGLENWQAPESLSYVRDSREVFAADRLDAEHYQPKFDEVLLKVCQTGTNLIPLGKIIRPIKNGFDARDFVEDGTPYIRVGDIKDCHICLKSAAKVAMTSEEINKDIALAVGDVLFTRKGTFGNAAPVFAEHTGAIISSEIMLLRLNRAWQGKILPEFLALFFNSLFGKMQAEKWAHGVAFYSIAQDDLQRFSVPVIDLEKQIEIERLFHAHKQKNAEAFHLLESAKRAVEIAIEENEASAEKWLREVTARV
jgi:type I restriction enzyme M protein